VNKDILPIVGITIGDAAGIGPEVVAKALQQREIYDVCRPLVIGDARVFAPIRAVMPTLKIRAVERMNEATYTPGVMTLLDMQNLDPGDVQVGQVSPPAGKAAVEYVLKAADLAMDDMIDAVATAPLNKEAMRLAGYDYIGHTEILADVTHTPQCTTMLATPGLRVTHVTRHIPFKDIASYITRDNVLETIVITDEGMRALGYAEPRLAVAGLNPHNGEGGLLGREEIEAIAPAVEAAQAQGIDADGPIPADSVFFTAIRGTYDVVVCMYHDQGHIAIKVHGFERSITITLGLPIIRTSVDHGTAFDIAGQGIADETSMVEAITEAARMAGRTAARTAAHSRRKKHDA
jgi:4-hydroxythreonine-4-phosphate dehydrogenase